MLSVMGTKSAFLLIFSIGVLIIAYLRVRRYLEILKFKKINNCQPPIRAPQSERIIGLSAFLKVLSFRRDHVSLEQTLKKGLEVGRTNKAVLLGQNIVFTCDPENLKTVLATNFLDYGLGPRVHFMGPLLGEGIFTSDDLAWHHSRVSATTFKIRFNSPLNCNKLTYMPKGFDPSMFHAHSNC